MFANERLGIADDIFQCGESAFITDIADGHGRVAEQAAAFCALDGTALELSVED